VNKITQIKLLKYWFIIVCKKTLVEPAIRMSDIMKTYRDEENILFLPFPGNGNQKSIEKA